MAATLSGPELARQWSDLRRSFAGEMIAPGKTTGFSFDPDYARFLEGVRRLTPPNATIVITAPPHPDVYVYQAAYQLAPRRILTSGGEKEADFVAAYRYQYREVRNPDIVQIPGGALFRRR